MSNQPQLVNTNHFSTEKFPDIIAFCEKDPKSHIVNGEEESFVYTLAGTNRYTLKKHGSLWELVQHDRNTIVRVSTGKTLGLTLMQGLRFSDADKGKQDERVSIIFPVQRRMVDEALALMYYYGGYPNNFLHMTPELALLIERYISPDILFLSYSYVPIAYVEWLREQLKNASIIESGTTKTLWVYKK
jgi:hypothetical protein